MEFNASVINNIGWKVKYACIKKSAEKDKKKIGYFFMERCGWVNIKISQVNISEIPIEEIKYNVIIKNSLTLYGFYKLLYFIVNKMTRKISFTIQKRAFMTEKIK